MEIDVDCGGPLCATLAAPKRCPIGGPCLNDADCATGICDEHPGRAGTPAIFAEGVTAVTVNIAGVFVVNTTLVRGRCVSYTDGTRNADETGVDCGGGTALAAAACPRCPDGSPCASGSNCGADSTCVDCDGARGLRREAVVQRLLPDQAGAGGLQALLRRGRHCRRVHDRRRRGHRAGDGRRGRRGRLGVHGAPAAGAAAQVLRRRALPDELPRRLRRGLPRLRGPRRLPGRVQRRRGLRRLHLRGLVEPPRLAVGAARRLGDARVAVRRGLLDQVDGRHLHRRDRRGPLRQRRPRRRRGGGGLRRALRCAR